LLPVKSRPSLILHTKTFEYSRRGNYTLGYVRDL
jgi:hypothetical protein